MLVIEVGKTINEARGEVARMVDTFRASAEEATRIAGEWMPLDIGPKTVGKQAIWRRFPIGVCAFITPFNFPLNLAAHKIGPAIAVGCPFVLKPASATPISAVLLGEILAALDLPEGTFSILPSDSNDAELLATDPRTRKLSFTGSAKIGWKLQRLAVGKRVTLELGGNAACIVDAGCDVNKAVERITVGAFYQAGQSCISVQRVLVHGSLYEEVKSRLVDVAKKLKTGDPADESTQLGPLITVDDAKRVEQWVNDAIAKGARLLCGGQRDGAIVSATYLENVPADSPLNCDEVFGPVATLQPFDDFDDAIRIANDTRYGLQCGVFTNNLAHTLQAFEQLDVGGVIINDVPSFRVDTMPYGGVKDSGLGREGVRFAIEEMTERRLMVLGRP